MRQNRTVQIEVNSEVIYKAKAPRQQTFLFHFSTADKKVTEPTPKLRHKGSRFPKLKVSKGVFIAGQLGCVKAT